MLIGALLSFLVIVGRAFFYFHDQINSVIFLDLASLLVFTALIIVRRGYIYPAIVAFLPSVSLYMRVQGKPISDLTFVLILLTVCLLFHGIHSFNLREGGLHYFIAIYILMLSVYLFSNSANLLLDWQIQPVFARFLNYLVMVPCACFLFAMVYRKEDAGLISDSFLAGAAAYILGATMGYFYLEKLDLPDYISDITKELFRYPGFSNSNYTGNLILAMIAIAYSLRKSRFTTCILLVPITAFLSQSRSVFLGGLVFLSYGIYDEGKRAGRRALLKPLLISVVILTAAYISLPPDSKLHSVASEYVDRVFGGAATYTINERADLVQAAMERSTDRLKNLLLGAGQIEDGWNPHNSVMQSLLLFGIGPTLVFLAYCIYIGRRVPIALFAIVASLGEILFFTSSYDFLFFILIAVNAIGITRKHKAGNSPGLACMEIPTYRQPA